MDEHLKAVIEASLDAWHQTNGDFDITVLPLVEAWGFSARHQDHYPDSPQIRQLLTCLGSDKLSMNGNHLIKSKPCIHIDPDGIAQGYSVDVLANFLEQHAINNYLVELGGELRVKGRKRIGIEAPNEDAFEQPVIQKILYVDSGAITTSGNYRAFHEHNGKKFSHTIDPHTGYPAGSEVISVTVYAKTAMTADAYDNVFVLMGLQKAVEFINRRRDLAAFFIYRMQDGSIGTYSTKSFNALLQP
jgi:thiamine biosynthesis lipoprotein